MQRVIANKDEVETDKEKLIKKLTPNINVGPTMFKSWIQCSGTIKKKFKI